jgi:hypothetical protein
MGTLMEVDKKVHIKVIVCSSPTLYWVVVCANNLLQGADTSSVVVLFAASVQRQQVQVLCWSHW